ncbi:DUF4268 domain-containing protein [Ammonifex degensii]|uniref:DUF4268 domain-containing protein n=1 Tax=Ammonifex degensii TaxID=42838 RepID=UPI0002E1F5A8|nr:DUF4268 domain-containing protein [Ammonifex degensii]
MFKIGDSLPAPNFNVVVQPSGWVKQQQAPRPSPRQEAYRQFFTGVLEKLRERFPGLTAARKGLPQSWLSIGAGRTGFNFAVAFARDGKLRVELCIDLGSLEHNKEAFDLLYAQREEIEKEVGQALSWEELPRARRIAVYTDGTVEEPPERLNQLQDWAVEMLGRFARVFRDRIAALPKGLGTRE